MVLVMLGGFLFQQKRGHHSEQEKGTGAALPDKRPKLFGVETVHHSDRSASA